jgi:hypothetical protein
MQTSGSNWESTVTRGGKPLRLSGLPSRACEDLFDHRLLKDGGDDLQLA